MILIQCFAQNNPNKYQYLAGEKSISLTTATHMFPILCKYKAIPATRAIAITGLTTMNILKPGKLA